MSAVMSVAPARSIEQRMEALVKANDIRTHRAELKRSIARGDTSAWDALTCGDPRLDAMKVYELLLAIPKVGRIKANKAFAAARISPSKTIGGISVRQREELRRFMPLVTVRGDVLRGRPLRHMVRS